MAVSKLWPVTARLGQVLRYVSNPEKTRKSETRFQEADYQALKDVLAYAQDEEKTEQELFCVGINCNPATAREQFVMVKERFGKTDGIQAYHGYLSFREENITPELASRIGLDFARSVWGDRFQVVVTTHLNTKHLHCHFVINSVSFQDGKRLHGEEKAWFKFRHRADEICRKYGLHVVERPQRQKTSEYLTRKEQAGMPTRYSLLRQALDQALAESRTKKQLEYRMKQLGYICNLDERRKYWTILPPGSQRPVRLYRLGEAYSKEKILERLRQNAGQLEFSLFQRASPKPAAYRLTTRKDKIRRKGGLYGLYLYYCYLLGYFPSFKKSQPLKIPSSAREDLAKLEKLTAQVTLLSRNHIDTEEQLFSYRQGLEEQVSRLVEQRRVLRNRIRRVGVSEEEKQEAKETFPALSIRLKKLREEIRLCDGIAERSGIIRARLEKVLEKKEQEKEMRMDDRKR